MSHRARIVATPVLELSLEERCGALADLLGQAKIIDAPAATGWLLSLGPHVSARTPREVFGEMLLDRRWLHAEGELEPLSHPTTYLWSVLRRVRGSVRTDTERGAEVWVAETPRARVCHPNVNVAILTVAIKELRA